jgi:hypothetical protein
MTTPRIPLAATLAPLSADDPLTSAQWKTILAIFSTVIPSIQSMSNGARGAGKALEVSNVEYDEALKEIEGWLPKDADKSVVQKYLSEDLGEISAAKDAFYRMLTVDMPVKSRKDLLSVLSLLE